MQVIIKGSHGFKVPEDLKSYIEEKVSKYEDFLEEPAVCEIMIGDTNGPKGGVDKTVHITLELPNEKIPLHVEVTTDDYMGSIDLAQEKLEQQILKYKERVKVGDRYPKKYYEEKKENDESEEAPEEINEVR